MASVVQVYSASYIFAPTDEEVKSATGPAQDEESLDAPVTRTNDEGKPERLTHFELGSYRQQARPFSV